MSVGKLERVPLREVWRHEAADLTTWLEDNIDVLNEVLDITISNAEREQAAEAFSVDLVGEDTDGATVIIENQLEQSDHDHLGKVITYLASLEAKAAVWIVARPRPEHARAITWLNEATSTPFYLVQVEAVRIGGPQPAPLFTVIVGPSEEARAAGQVRKDLSERHRIRKRFWTALLAKAKERTQLHARISPQHSNWLGAGSGVSGLSWVYSVLQHETQIELNIDRGDEELNRRIFDRIAARQEEIDARFGDELVWQRLEGKRACRIRHRMVVGGWRDENNWDSAIDEAVDAMLRLEKALGDEIREIRATL